MLVNKHNDKIPLVEAFHVIKALKGIPEDLLDLFIPESKEGFDQLEINIVKWLARVDEREKVMRLQKYYGLPLRPNQSLKEVTIRIRILELKKRKGYGSNDSIPDKDNYET